MAALGQIAVKPEAHPGLPPWLGLPLGLFAKPPLSKVTGQNPSFGSLGPLRSGWAGGTVAQSLPRLLPWRRAYPKIARFLKITSGFCLAFALKDIFFPFCTELCNSRKVSLSWQLNGTGKAGKELCPGVCTPLGSHQGHCWSPGSRDQVGDRRGALRHSFPALQYLCSQQTLEASCPGLCLTDKVLGGQTEGWDL